MSFLKVLILFVNLILIVQAKYNIPQCGISEGWSRKLRASEGLEGRGTPAKDGEVPWHVGIYSKEYKPYTNICGGTLISDKVVISVAHCFYDETNKRLYPASNYAAAVGKLQRQWDDPKDQKAYKSDIKEIKIPALFQGVTTNYQEDISILILATPILAMPACINFDINFERLQLKSDNVGKMASYELSDSELKISNLPYINTETCLKEIPINFMEYFTSDKFCAGYANRTFPCNGVSGSGLTFEDSESDRYYLRGLASVASKTDNDECQSIILFTQISKYDDFIKSNLNVK